MFLLQTARPPFVFQIADENGRPKYELSIPKFTLADAVAWGNVICEEWSEAAMKDLNPVQRREHTSMYPQIPPTLQDLKRMIATIPGAQKIIEECFPRATIFSLSSTKKVVKQKVKDGEVEKTIEVFKRGENITTPELTASVQSRISGGNGSGTLIALARILADLEDTSTSIIEIPPDDSDGGEVTDPLKSVERKDSTP